jgi:hypothetical protein
MHGKDALCQMDASGYDGRMLPLSKVMRKPMGMRAFHTLAIGTLIAFQAHPVQARTTWPVGTYVFDGGKGNSGTLTIHSVGKKTATFSIEAVSCRRDCETDTPYVNVGSIERGTMEITGSSGRYRSAGPEEETQDAELGVCVLQFSLQRRAITVTQLSNCWWFGHGVYAFGTYKLSPHYQTK